MRTLALSIVILTTLWAQSFAFSANVEGNANEAAIKETSRQMTIPQDHLVEYLKECDTAINQLTMNVCAQYHFIEKEIELNEIYEKLLTRYQGQQKKRTAAVQKKWLQIRDKNCDDESSQ
jgi:uncharacterized protein YecT (DUF1311 family)